MKSSGCCRMGRRLSRTMRMQWVADRSVLPAHRLGMQLPGDHHCPRFGPSLFSKMRHAGPGTTAWVADVAGERFSGTLTLDGPQFGIARRFCVGQPAGAAKQLSCAATPGLSGLLSSRSGHDPQLSCRGPLA